MLYALGRLAREDPDEEPRVAARIRRLATAPIARFNCTALLAHGWELRDNVAVRDALYVTLARRLSAPLLTADRRLTRAPAALLGVEIRLP